MVKDRSVVSQQTDIFALGCTVSEVITGKQLFPRDFDVFQYMYTAILPQDSALEVDARSKAYIAGLMSAMLEIDWRNRPSATDILREIGDPQIDWREWLDTRAKEQRYPDETSSSWVQRKWKRYWHVNCRFH